ncbi:MAG: TlpA family protein disulfide reductase [Deltaproteobacteria bacterium]|nr:TlpA family protein disulfide reductase [Deltaproteobacteria bacterium]MCB9786178.1 TlpA family protein disulfide reductase [Deltaproteobacteria bacterium]
MRHLILLPLLAALAACELKAPPKPASPSASRVAAVRADPEASSAGEPGAASASPKDREAEELRAAAAFCDKHWLAADAPDFTGPALKPLSPEPAPPAGAWRWVNFWATWCGPCIEEMPLLARWRDALAKEDHPLELELWSVDVDEAKLRARAERGMPGTVRWTESPEALASYLTTLGLSGDSAIPIHMLVDPQGKLRCVRVGSVKPENWGGIRALLGD